MIGLFCKRALEKRLYFAKEASKRDLHIQQSYAKETHIYVNEAILHLM